MMKVFIRIVTGQGIRLQGDLDLAEVPQDLARHAQNVLTKQKLARAVAAETNPLLVDMQEYEVVIFPEDQREQPQRYTFTESEDNIEVAELLDELMREIVIRKKRSSNSDTSH